MHRQKVTTRTNANAFLRKSIVIAKQCLNGDRSYNETDSHPKTGFGTAKLQRVVMHEHRG